MASRADDAEGRFSGKPCARGNVENAHTWRDVSRAQQEGSKMSRDARESAVVAGSRFIFVGQFLRHLGNLVPDIAKG